MLHAGGLWLPAAARLPAAAGLHTTMGMKTPPPWVRSPCVALGQDAVYGEAQLEGVAQEQRDPCPSPADEVSCGRNAQVSHPYSHATC